MSTVERMVISDARFAASGFKRLYVGVALKEMVKYLVVRICLTKIEDAFTTAKNYCVFFVDIYQ